MDWADKLDFAGLTDVGMRRSNNQDAFRSLPAATPELWRSRGHLFLVADGMGAHAVGELASKLATDAIPHTYHKLDHLPCSEALAKAFQDTNGLIFNRASANRDFMGMGTTSTALALLPEGAVIAHVGDSRAYRVRGSRIEQLSFDHSLAWELVRRKQLTLDQARQRIPANVITRSLGPEPEVEVDVEGPHEVLPGDVFVLCTDGLSGPVKDQEIGVFAQFLPAADACQYLIDLANLRGGPDNITVIIVRVGHPTDAGTEQEGGQPADRGIGTGRSLNTQTVCGLAIWAAGVVGAAIVSVLDIGVVQKISAIAMIGAAGAALGALLLRVRAKHEEAALSTPGRWYRRVKSVLDQAQIRRLTEELQQLHKLALEEAWNVNWSDWYSYRRAADEAAGAGDLPAALKHIGQALHEFALAQSRRRRETKKLLES